MLQAEEHMASPVVSLTSAFWTYSPAVFKFYYPWKLLFG